MTKFLYNIADKNACFLIKGKLLVTCDTEKQTLLLGLVTNTPQSSSLKKTVYVKLIKKICLFIR